MRELLILGFVLHPFIDLVLQDAREPLSLCGMPLQAHLEGSKAVKILLAWAFTLVFLQVDVIISTPAPDPPTSGYFLDSVRMVTVPVIGMDIGPCGPPSALIVPEICCVYVAPTVHPLASSICSWPLRSPVRS